jgi:hypothetical protein
VNEYQRERFETLTMVRDLLKSLSAAQTENLKEKMKDYLQFRSFVDDFQFNFFTGACVKSCFENRKSACCSKKGTITFWGDVMINALSSTEKEIESLLIAFLNIGLQLAS